MSTPSRYAPIWETIKSNGIATLVIMPEYKLRIVKAVKKRKDTDLVFKLQNAENNLVTRLSCRLKGNILTIKLLYSITLEGL